MSHNGYDEPVDNHLPIDDIEPLENTADHVRDARVQAVMLLNRFASLIESALNRPNGNKTDVATVFWGACYALGLNVCEGMSMSERALSLGCERATVSKVATHFCRAAALEPSFYMKCAGSQGKYRDARVRVVMESCSDGFAGPPVGAPVAGRSRGDAFVASGVFRNIHN